MSPARAFRNVLVIGATSGLGQAVAREFAPVADTVHLTYHSGRETAEKLAKELVDLGGQGEVHQVTLPDPDVAGGRIRRLMADVTPCDVVVNCAITNEPALATIANAERFKRMIDANVFGTYQICSVAAQALVATGGGSVVNISSILTEHYIVGAMGYVTSKTAIEGMTRGFAREWGRLGVRFVAVAPGPIRDTGLLATVPREALEAIVGADVEAALMPPEEVAAAVRGVVGHGFAAVNGVRLVVDHGASL